jgi:hypothetical protein
MAITGAFPVSSKLFSPGQHRRPACFAAGEDRLGHLPEMRLRHGQAHRLASRRDLIGDEAFRKLAEILGPFDVPGDREFARWIVFDDFTLHVDAAVWQAQHESATALRLDFNGTIPRNISG